jgi:hypothetical protein
VSRREEITLFINGIQTQNFDFSGNQVIFNTQLQRGNNNIKITVANAGGTASDELTLASRQMPSSIFSPKVLTLDVTRPVINPMDPSPPSSTITATFSKMRNANVELYINGQLVPNAVYDPDTQVLTHSFVVTAGKYTVRVVISNGKLSDEKTTEVTF